MSGEEINGLYALAVVLAGGALSIGVGLLVAHFLFDDYGRLRRWRR